MHKHPEITDRTVWQVFEAERAPLVPIGSRFDGFDNNRYSVSSRAVGRPVDIQAGACPRAAHCADPWADRIVIRQDGAIVGEHPRCFGRGETVYDPLALRAGARPQARRAAQRSPIQGLAAAGQPGAGSGVKLGRRLTFHPDSLVQKQEPIYYSMEVINASRPTGSTETSIISETPPTRGRGRPPLLTGGRRYPNRLREWRTRRGLPQRAVAKVAGMSGAYYGALERGDKRINADTGERLARALGCAVGELLGGGHGASAPLALAVAAAETEARPSDYDLPEPHRRLLAHGLPEAEDCVAAEIVDDSADVDFASRSVLFLRRLPAPPGNVRVGAKVLVRFFLDPPSGAGSRRTHEILYGIIDRNIVGDLVLITRTRNRRISRHALIQSAAPRRPGRADQTLAPREAPIDYAPRPDDPAELLGTIVYAMGPV